MARGEDQDETPGGDSFLDIVANIVGILVLLVVVVGVRAGRAVTAPPESAPHTEQIVEDAKHAIREALLSRQDVQELIEQTVFSQAETALREKVREELASFVAHLRAELDAERAELSQADRETFDRSADLAKAHLEVQELSRRQLALLGAEPSTDTERIEVDPTPIVRERVEDEVWVRLEEDRVAFLPMEDLKRELDYQVDAIRAALGSTSGGSATVERVVGPVDGFALRCLFQRRQVNTPQGALIVTGLRAARIETQGDPPTETVDNAILAGSDFLARLEGVDPKKTVITVIAYPDSFDALPEFESNLRERGFRVAKALQPEGKPITFSPNGQTTVLQ